MGAGQSQPISTDGLGAVNLKQLYSITRQYQNTHKKLRSLEELQTSQVDDLEKQKSEFRNQLATLQKDFEAKLGQQLQRNAELNARQLNLSQKNSALQQKIKEYENSLAELEGKQTAEKQEVLAKATEEAELQKQKVLQNYVQQLGSLSGMIKEKETELAGLNARSAEKAKKNANLNANVRNKQQLRNQLNATVQNLSGQRNTLSANLNAKQQTKRELNTSIQNLQATLPNLSAEKEKVQGELNSLKETYAQKQQEMQEQLAEEESNQRRNQIEKLQLNLSAQRNAFLAEKDAILKEAEAKKQELLAESEQQIAAERQAFEQQKLADLAKQQAEAEKERLAIQQEMQRTQEAIRFLEQKAATNQSTSAELSRKQAELAGLQAEQEALAAEKVALAKEKEESQALIRQAEQQAKDAAAELLEAQKALQTAKTERRKAEAIEEYRKKVYKILGPWIDPLKKGGIETFHDDVNDDYFFIRAGKDRKDWIAKETLDDANRRLGLQLVWQPRPPKEQFIQDYVAQQTGGRRGRRSNSRSRKANRKSVCTRKRK